MDIVVFGAGSLGSLFGALLARTAEHDVTLVGRDPHVAAVRKSGLAVTGTDSFTVHPKATTDGTGLSADLALVTVKAFDTETAARELATGEFRAVCSLQNGMGNEETLARHLDCPVLAGTTSYGAARSAPGEVEWNGRGDLSIGPWEPSDADAIGEEVGAAFAAADVPATVATADGIRRLLWRKLAVNAAINPVTALARVPNGALSGDPGVGLAEPVAREVAATARAVGVDLGDAEAVEAVAEVVRATAENDSSMYRDVERGRRTEVDVINGYVVGRADENGVEVPTNRTLWGLIRTWEAERGLVDPEPSTESLKVPGGDDRV
ncbi:ketopantoate reductase family protein [Halobellus rufus]|uniref:ketopantoate reductase family protein n=1 Tax=Halobellus rufus TaxID=1448860 RepID=UPI0006798420|nr:2-dehydropantoate 2-reductase [Halobellus rufus]